MDKSEIVQRRLACLGDPSRFRIVQRLATDRLCVSELASEVQLSQSCTTRHLQALSGVGMLRPERQGKRVLYVLRDEDPDVARLLHWFRIPTIHEDATTGADDTADHRRRDSPPGVRAPRGSGLATERSAPAASPVEVRQVRDGDEDRSLVAGAIQAGTGPPVEPSSDPAKPATRSAAERKVVREPDEEQVAFIRPPRRDEDMEDFLL